MAKLLVTDEALRQRLLSKGIDPDAKGNADKLQQAGFNVGDQPEGGPGGAMVNAVIGGFARAGEGIVSLPADVGEAIVSGIQNLRTGKHPSRSLEDLVTKTGGGPSIEPTTAETNPAIHEFFDRWRPDYTPPTDLERAHPVASGLAGLLPLLVQLRLTGRAGGALADTSVGRAVLSTRAAKAVASGVTSLEERSLLATRGIKLAASTTPEARTAAIALARSTPPRFGMFSGLQPSAMASRMVRDIPLFAAQTAIFTSGTPEDRLRAAADQARFAALFSALGSPEGLPVRTNVLRSAAAGAITGSTPYGMFGDPTGTGLITETAFGAVTGFLHANPVEAARPVNSPGSMPGTTRTASPEAATKGPTVLSGNPTVAHLQTTISGAVDSAARLAALKVRVDSGEVTLPPEQIIALNSALAVNARATTSNTSQPLFPDNAPVVSINDPVRTSSIDLRREFTSSASGISRLRTAIRITNPRLGEGSDEVPEPPLSFNSKIQLLRAKGINQLTTEELLANAPSAGGLRAIAKEVGVSPRGTDAELASTIAASGNSFSLAVERPAAAAAPTPLPTPHVPPAGKAPQRVIPISPKLPEGHAQLYVDRSGLWSLDASGNYFLTREKGTSPTTRDAFVDFMDKDAKNKISRYVAQQLGRAVPSSLREAVTRAFSDLVGKDDRYNAWATTLDQPGAIPFGPSHYHELFNIAMAQVRGGGVTLDAEGLRTVRALRASVARLGPSTDPALIVAYAYRGDPSLGRSNRTIPKNVSQQLALDLYHTVVTPGNTISLSNTIGDSSNPPTVADTATENTARLSRSAPTDAPAPTGPATTAYQTASDALQKLVEDAMERHAIDPYDPKANALVVASLKKLEPDQFTAMMSLATSLRDLKDASLAEIASADHGGPTLDGPAILTDSPIPTLDEVHTALPRASELRASGLDEVAVFETLFRQDGLHPWIASEAAARAFERRGGNRNQPRGPRPASVANSITAQAEANVSDQLGRPVYEPPPIVPLPASEEAASPVASAIPVSAAPPPEPASSSPSPAVEVEQAHLDAEAASLTSSTPATAPTVAKFDKTARVSRARGTARAKSTAAAEETAYSRANAAIASQINVLNRKLKSVLSTITSRVKTLDSAAKPNAKDRIRTELFTLVNTVNTLRAQIRDLSLPGIAAKHVIDAKLTASVDALQSSIEANRELILGGRRDTSPSSLVLDAMLRIGNASNDPVAPMTPAHRAALPHDLQHEHAVRRLLAPESQPGTTDTNANTRRFNALAGFSKGLTKEIHHVYAYTREAVKSGSSNLIARAFNNLSTNFETGHSKTNRAPDPLRGNLTLQTFVTVDTPSRAISRTYVLTDRITNERFSFPNPEAAALAADHIVADRLRSKELGPPTIHFPDPGFAPPRNPGSLPGVRQAEPIPAGNVQAHINFLIRYINSNSRAFAKISRILIKKFGNDLGLMDAFTRLQEGTKDHQNFKRIRDTERGNIYRYHNVHYSAVIHDRLHNAATQITRNVSNTTRSLGLTEGIASVAKHAADAARDHNLSPDELNILLGGIAPTDLTRNKVTIRTGEPLGIRGMMQKMLTDANLDAPEVVGFYYPLFHTNEYGVTSLDESDILKRSFYNLAVNHARLAEGIPEQQVWTNFQREVASALDIGQFSDLETTMSNYTHALYRYTTLAEPLTNMQEFIKRNAPMLSKNLMAKLESALYGFAATPTKSFQESRERTGRGIAFPIARGIKHLADGLLAVHVTPVAHALEHTYKALGVAIGRGEVRSIAEQFVWAHRNSIFALSAARAYRDAIGTSFFQLFPTFNIRDLTYAFANSIPFSRTLADHTIRLLNAGQIEADQGVRFVAQRSLKHETIDRLAYFSTWMYARQDRWIRVVAQLASEHAADRAVRDYRSGPHAGDFDEVLETTGLDTIDPAFSSNSQRAELKGMLERGATDEFAARLGHLMQQEVVFSYLISNAPGYYSSPAGRVLGQYGVWPIQMTQRLWSLNTAPFAHYKNADGSTNVRRATRRAIENNLKYAAAAGTLYSAGSFFNIDTSDWIPFIHNLFYTGGPGVTFFEKLHDIVSPQGVKRIIKNPGPEIAGIVQSGVPIPGLDFFKRAWSQYSFGAISRDAAVNSLADHFGSSPVAWERALGLPPLGDTPYTSALIANGFKPLINVNARPYNPDLFHLIGGAPGRALQDRFSRATGVFVAPGSFEELMSSNYEPALR